MNRILLDTHTLIWMVSDEGRLGDHAKDIVFESGFKKLVSPASYWEVAIKMKIGKLSLFAEYDEFFAQALADYDIDVLHVQLHHTSLLTQLELFHGDPFDRLLIAQASVENIPIVSIDSKFDPYPVSWIWTYSMQQSGNEVSVEVDGEAEDE